TRPALAVEPHLRPGVCIRLTNQEVMAEAVPLSTQVARDHACGHAPGAHQRRERRCIVLAEALVRGEQQIVDRIDADRRGLERIAEAAAMQVIECSGYVGGIVARAGAQLLREL